MSKTKFSTLVALILASSLVAHAPAMASTPTLPATTYYDDAGLQEMVRFSGPISVSIDGAGIAPTGTIQVEKPEDAVVIAAYLTSSLYQLSGSVPGVTLGGSEVDFTHRANATDGYGFDNYLADVTSIVKPIVDAAAPGLIDLELEETSQSDINDGQALVVVFADPAKTSSSVILMFGTSKTEGDEFTFTFPAITDAATQIPTLSLGITYSYQVGDFEQSSDIQISTSSSPTLRTVSSTAGGQDDGEAGDGQLITVGGIGDSTNIPSDGTSDDDELYGLGSFMANGDESLTINTRNESGDDNLFLSVLYFDGVAVEGATPVGEELLPEAEPAPENGPTLAETGFESAWLAAGLASILVGTGSLVAVRRRRTA